MATRRDRRWRYLTMEEVRDYARQADPLGVWGGRGLEHPRVETSRRLCGLSLTLELKEAGERLYAFAVPGGVVRLRQTVCQQHVDFLKAFSAQAP